MTIDEAVALHFGNKTVVQIAFLVEDLGTAMHAWSRVYRDPDDWLVFTYSADNVRSTWFDGDAGVFSFRVALAGSGPQVELIEPLDGRSIYDEHIRDRGYGLHHVAFTVPSIRATIDDFTDAGRPPRQYLLGQGLEGDGGSAYFDLDGWPVLVEALEVPALRRPSEPLPVAFEGVGW